MERLTPAGPKRAAAANAAKPFARWRGPRPSLLQWIFVVANAGLWIGFSQNIGGVGRPERLLALLGLVAVPVIVARRHSISLVMPVVVSIGLGLLLGGYGLAYLANSPDEWGATFLLGLSGRIVFLWLGYVLLQDRMLLHRAFWLLIGSSLTSAAVAVAVLTRYGVGFGRLSGMDLEAVLGPSVTSVFASAQAAPLGAVFLIGAASLRGRRFRFWATIMAVAIFGAAYMSFFRREFLITVPIMLVVLHFTGARIDRRLVAAAAAAFVGLVSWEFAGKDSVLRARMEGQRYAFVGDEETRVSTARAQLTAIEEAPLLGYGAGRHAEAIAPFVPPTERYLSGFNVYGWLAVEGGVPCLIGYLMILWGVFKRSWLLRGIPGETAEAVIIRCAPAAVVQIALWGVFGNAWEMPLAWFVMGMVLASQRVARGAASASIRGVPVRATKPGAIGSGAFRGPDASLGATA